MDELNKKIRTDFINKIQLKITELKIKFLNKFIASKDEYYSLEEPSMELMDSLGKTFWIQPYKSEEEN